MKKLLAIVVAVVVLLAGAGALLWFFVIKTDPAPKPEIVATPVEEDAPATELSGAWTVVAGVGETEDENSFVGYRVQEELRLVNQIATGRTRAVTGTMTIAGNEVTAVDVTADVTKLQSDQGLRDEAIRRDGLQTNEFPEATFTLTAPIALPEPVEAGSTYPVSATGDLTLHGQTKSVTVPLEARWDGARIQVKGTIPVLFADYGMSPLERAGIVRTADRGEVDINLWFEKA